MSLYKSEYEVKVSFEDLDPMHIVWHGNYLRWLEQARCKMFSELNYTYFDMGNEGVAYPVAKAELKYIKPAEFEDELIVKTEIMCIEPSLNINYTIYNKQTGEKIFKGSTMHIAVDIKTKTSVYIPPESFIRAIETAKK